MHTQQPNSGDTPDLLSDLLGTDLDLPTLARRHHLTPRQLLEWAESDPTSHLFESLQRLVNLRARYHAAEARLTALARLADIARLNPAHSETPAEREAALKAATLILRTNFGFPPVGRLSEPDPSPPSPPRKRRDPNPYPSIPSAPLSPNPSLPVPGSEPPRGPGVSFPCPGLRLGEGPPPNRRERPAPSSRSDPGANITFRAVPASSDQRNANTEPHLPRSADRSSRGQVNQHPDDRPRGPPRARTGIV